MRFKVSFCPQVALTMFIKRPALKNHICVHNLVKTTTSTVESAADAPHTASPSQAPPSSAPATSEATVTSSAPPLSATSSSQVPSPRTSSISPPSPSPTTAPSPSPSLSPPPVPTSTEVRSASTLPPRTSSDQNVPTTDGPTSVIDTELPFTTDTPSTASAPTTSAPTVPATFSTSGGITSPSATGTATPDITSSSGPSTPVIAGIITAVVLVVLVALGCVWWRNIRRKGDRRYNLDDLFAVGAETAATTARPFSLRRPDTTMNRTGTSPKASGSAARKSMYSAVPVSAGMARPEGEATAASRNSGQFLVSEANGQYAPAAQASVQDGAFSDPNAYYAHYYAAYGQYPSQQQQPGPGLQDANYYVGYPAAASMAKAGTVTPLRGESHAVSDKEGYPSGLLDLYAQAQPVEGLTAMDVLRATRGEAGSLPDKMQLKRESVQLWDVEDAVGWAVQTGFGEHGMVRAMQEQEIDGRSLLLLTRRDLEDVLGIRDEEVRTRFERALEELKQGV
ncbi:hypothetical protein BC830DRAFT_460658 [Chytriomyces sp. MP71]|nr:hypothetical protein BC830DRAFT_460658 [Chytriomyces sp. MP71]